MNTSKLKYIAFSLLSSILLLGCAQQNASIVKQTYHDLTGHYNTYFNGYEQYKLALKDIETNRTENYDTILPLFAYGTVDDTKGKASQFETAIKKAELTVQLHQEKEGRSNYKKNGENSISNWADDAFLLIGKSYFMMGEYEKSINSFRYITAHFFDAVDARSDKKAKKQRTNKKRKAKAKKQAKKDIAKEKEGKDIRPSKSLFAHEAAKSEALVWLARAYIADKDYQSADAVLTFIGSDKSFLKNYDADVSLTKAHLYKDQGNFNGAIPYMEKAMEQIKSQKKKSRYQFVLAQLYEASGNNALAANYYNESIKGNPNFEMAFYSRFKLIQMSHADGSDKEKATKLIAKLIRDSKNRDFQDLLYYEKALFALEDNDRKEAKKLLAKSIERSTINTNQKAKSYALLAEMNYEEELYVNSQALYDSTLQLIDRKFENYTFIENRSTVLNELIGHLNTIQMNDSLLLIADMSEADRKDFLYNLAVDMVEEEEDNKAKQLNQLVATAVSNSSKEDKKSWYFYSETAKSAGYKKFKETWGDRTLEDDWRRSNKGSSDVAEGEEEIESGDDGFFAKVDERYAAFEASIPTTPEAKEQLKQEIILAYYGAGISYQLGLENTPKAVNMYEKLLDKYPKNSKETESYYNLYILYKEKGNKAKADYYKDLLLKNYPDSEFAKMATNPEYVKEKNKQIAAVVSYYEESYTMYEAGSYDKVILRSDDAKTKFADNHLQAKFDLLKALAIGQKKLFDPYVSSLKYVIQNYKNTEEGDKAKEILAYLMNEKTPEQKLNENTRNQQKNKGKLKEEKGDKDEIESGVKENKDGVRFKFGDKEIKLGGDEKVNKGPK